MISRRTKRTGPCRPVRFFYGTFCAVAALAVAVAPPPLSSFEASAQARQTADVHDGQEIPHFYRARNWQPLWLGQSGSQVEILLELLNSAAADGLDQREFRTARLERALRAAWGGKQAAVRKADVMLSEAFVSYVRQLRTPKATGVIYVDAELRPSPPSPRAILEAAAQSPSLERHVAQMAWMHPLYGQLRQSLTGSSHLTRAERERIRINLERARELPPPVGRHILVNAAAQKLFMYDRGQVVGSMRVVVGKPIYPTPMMAGLIRYTSLNPYWYVPPDLAAERIAPNVVKEGVKYLRSRGYQLVSDFVENPKIFDPKLIDWKAVAEGRERVLIRQLPGPGNSMGRMKFMFPNSEGIYLHDTPEKELLEEASRLFSGGCVRLEDAPRLAEWLYGRKLSPQGAQPEQKVPLETPVPVYLTYLTAVPDGHLRLAFFDDIYGRDAQRLAQIRSSGLLTSSR